MRDNSDELLAWKWGQMRQRGAAAAAKAGKGGGTDRSSCWTTLTSTGTGAGVSTLLLRVSSNIVVTLDGAAKFYTDIDGTLGETDTWNVTTGADRTIYFKCPSGTANLKYGAGGDVDKVTKIIITNPVNAASISFDVSKMVNLTYIVCDSLNTIYGDLSALTSLTWVTLWGSHTCTCDITDLVDLIHFDYHGSAAAEVHGSVTGLTKIVFLEVKEPTNNLSGSITNMPDLYNFWMRLGTNNNNTMTGSLEGKPDLLIFNDDGLLSSYSGSIDDLGDLINLRLYGLNHQITGDLGASGLSALLIEPFLNSCHMDTYTGGATWLNYDVKINPSAGYGFSSAEIDAILTDMAASVALVSKTITLLGSSMARTSASDAAVATLTGVGRTNTIVTQPIPTFVSAAISDAAKSNVVLTYSAALDETSTPDTDDFTVTDKTISSVVVSGTTVTLTVTAAFAYGDTANVTYTADTNKIRSIYHALAADLGSTAITNNVQPILGAELVDQDNWYKMAYWNVTTNWSQDGNTLKYDFTTAGILEKNTFWTIGTKYRTVMTFTFVQKGGGYIRNPYDRNIVDDQLNTAQTVVSDYIPGATKMGIVAFTCTAVITALSIKEITG